ncbi:MAG: Vacuolar protein sorting-associated protein 8 [Alectoria fallacina]|uniref:Vacuolar protein sorting-associated protein 8 n=1 Tax=Alectoria fallacina TaxID=1903189 RepID=A0A8H3EVK4_9LECA|nr:MAG: Vacuolar protein sorting-associated protein 8 [Alectoria fallacina]
MSAAKDEAEDGPLVLNKEDDENDEKTPQSDEDEQTQEEELLKPKLSKPNGFEEDDSLTSNNEVDGEDFGPLQTSSPVPERPSSADESLSIPDDTPSLQGSIESSSPSRGIRISNHSRSPTPSLRPFDKRFQARLTPSPLNSPRASSPAFLDAHSRQSSSAFSINNDGSTGSPQAPWEVVRWTKLRKMTGEAFSGVGKRKFGRPTCIAIAASIALGTSKGIILVFDYNQNLKSIIGLGTKAVESGSVTSISISADHSTIAGGHASGSIFTWEVARPAKPFLHIPPIDRGRGPNTDGHTLDVAILHIGFLGMRHTALASADDKGMAFSHLATRGMGVVVRSVKTTRILGRYPDKASSADRQRKPSSVLAFSTLPLGNAEHVADSLGLVAMLTPYLLVIVSTTPIAQTQYKAPRPKEVAAHGAMTAALAWFPSVKLKTKDPITLETSSRVKLVYCWSNILTVLDVVEMEPSASRVKDEPPSLQFTPRSRWKAEEAIVSVQWLSRSVLAVLTITQQLIILEDNSMVVTDSSDLIQKHIYHADLFSGQLNQLVDELEDEEVAAMHGVVADAFYMSFRAYKGRLFLLGYNEISFGTLSNWADRLLALMEEGSHIAAIQLATSYYSGEANKVAVGLPEDTTVRHNLVQEKLSEMISASLRYTFNKNRIAQERSGDRRQLEELASACIKACISMEETDFLFENVYSWYQDGDVEGVFLESLETYIVDDEISVISPVVIKDLIDHYTGRGLNARIEEMICHLDARTMDIDQITTLCKKNHLYDALLYVWNQTLNDYTTILTDLLDLTEHQYNSQSDVDPSLAELESTSASKVFPYLSYVLTGRIYPTGKDVPNDSATLAKAEIYHFFFSGSSREGLPVTQGSPRSSKFGSPASFPNMRRILNFDAASFLSMLNEAFEDSFLNGPQDQMANEIPGRLTEEQKFGLSVNRQWIVSILLEVMTPPNYESDDTVYLDMFIARNLPKFPQFILLPGHVLHRVLVGLCQYPTNEVADDCQLSVEYLLSMYQPPDLTSLIPLISKARFYRVLKSIYKQERQFAELLKTCFEDHENQDAIFDCIGDCLKPSAALSEKQISEVRDVIAEHAYDLVAAHAQRAASTIETYAPDLHSVLLDTLGDDEGAQFQYLQMVLEPSTPKAEADQPASRQREFVEQYVRLMCDFSRPHVSEYVDQLKTGDLRLEEVLPSLENSGVVDAAVVLMAREGQVREAIDRLTHYLITLESALLGLIDGVNDSLDVGGTAESGQDLIASVQKYARVGVWLCQGQTKAAQTNKPVPSRAKSDKSLHDVLSLDEELWLDLVDAVVAVTKDVTEVLERQDRAAEISEDDTSQQEPHLTNLDSSRMITDLRVTVQETFTALLAATSAPHNKDARRTDVSFLRILRAFLDRASLSSPSLSNLRAVLGAIFSAYSYEESLLSLANRLLDNDLFVHVTEADTLRRRGWRPLGQVCEGCGKRIWGPGAGGYIWDAWQRNNEEKERVQQLKIDKRPPRRTRKDESGKGKGINRNDGNMAISESTTGNGNIGGEEESGAVVIFSCRHMFHRACLIKMQDRGSTNGGQTAELGPNLVCPLET